MLIERIDETLESILFLSGDGIQISDLVNLLEMQKSEIKASIERLKVKYSGDCGIHLIMYNNKVQFSSNPQYSDIISQVLNPIKEKQLSKSALETVAIIAYKQPITRLEIEQIRGVSCDYAIQLLLKHNIITVVGRKEAVGKPILFGTTEEFLKRFQIESIEALPDYSELLSSLNELTEVREKSLYNEFEIKDEEVAAADFEFDGDATLVENN